MTDKSVIRRLVCNFHIQEHRLPTVQLLREAMCEKVASREGKRQSRFEGNGGLRGGKLQITENVSFSLRKMLYKNRGYLT